MPSALPSSPLDIGNQVKALLVELRGTTSRESKPSAEAAERVWSAYSARCAELAASYYAGIEEVAEPPTLDPLVAAEAARLRYVSDRMPGITRRRAANGGFDYYDPAGRPISDPEITRWRWSESINSLNIRRRGPYHARHSSVTWQLMLGKNLLWVAKQHGHSVEVMLRMYAAWLDGATDTDFYAIKQAMERRPAARAAFLDSRAAISAVNTATNRARFIVIRPPESRNLAVV